MTHEKKSNVFSIIVGILVIGVVSAGSYYLGFYHSLQKRPSPTVSIPMSTSRITKDCRDEILGLTLNAPPGWTCNSNKVSPTGSSISLSSGFFNIQISNSPRSEFCVSDPSVYGYDANCTVTTFYSTPSILTAIYAYQGKPREIYGSVLKANNKHGTPVPWISIKYQNMENKNLSDDQKNGLIGVLNSISSL